MYTVFIDMSWRAVLASTCRFCEGDVAAPTHGAAGTGELTIREPFTRSVLPTTRRPAVRKAARVIHRCD